MRNILFLLFALLIGDMFAKEQNGVVLAVQKIEMSERVQNLCPYTQKEIDKESYGDFDGKRVYFCCDGCLARFKNNPEKAIRKLEESGVEAAETDEVTKQEICPVNDKLIDKKLYENHDHKRIYFCSEKCRNKFKKNPQKFTKNE